MRHCYFDIETTGLDPNKDKILTFQYQELSQVSGTPLTKLLIVKEWDYDYSETKILEWLKTLLIDSPFWKFVPVGNNLVFDLSFIAARMRIYFHADFLMQLINRPFIDLKHVLVMINVNYVEMEAKAFLRTYGILKRNLPAIGGLIA